jgi:hypothetical protein
MFEPLTEAPALDRGDYERFIRVVLIKKTPFVRESYTKASHFC